HTRRPAADHANLRMQIFNIRMDPRHMLDVDTTQAGKVAQRVLEQRPKPARSVEALVIKSNRQKAVETIKRAEHIKAERRPGILMEHDLSLPGRLDTGAHIGPLVHVHETVRAIAGNAQESAWAMILEAAREDPHSRGMEGGR